MDLRKIKALLSEKFTTEELRQFCFNVPEFRPVYDRSIQSSDKAEFIAGLVEYAAQNSQLDKLVTLIEVHNIITSEQPQPQTQPTLDTDLVGKSLGKYYIAGRLNRGGAATVYKAYQSGLYRYVAIKMMHSYLAADENFVERFEREAIAVARLRHPHIVQVFDFDLAGNLYYMVMEFVDGPTMETMLEERKKKGRLFPLTKIVPIFNALASAIDYAHSQGVIHRDLKPGNIMFNAEGEVMLTDFGIAHFRDAPHYTLAGAVTGTPTYMSPEQARGEKVDETSDIYSLGIILYEMTTGHTPFEADTPYAMIMKQAVSSFPPPTQINPTLPPSVEQVVLKAMSKNPADRYRTATEMAQALQKAAGTKGDRGQQANDVATISSDARAKSPQATTITDQLIGQVLNERYQIADVLDIGGMGMVFKGNDLTLQRQVAIKIMHPHLAQRTDLTERFLREARAAARLNHAGIVKVFDFGQMPPYFYIVMEFIPGASLYQKLRELRRTDRWIHLAEAIQLTRQLCLALDYAHRHQVLHRDIKPHNIMLKPEAGRDLPYQPVITDLGLAKILVDQSTTNPGVSLGTPVYMSPEQATGQPVDARSDVYSLGALLYKLVTGLAPVPIKSFSEAIRYHTQTPPPSPPSLPPDLPEAVKRIIRQALARNPAARFPDAGTMAQALARTLPEVATASSVPTDPPATVSLMALPPADLDLRPQPPAAPVAIPDLSLAEPGQTTLDIPPARPVVVRGDLVPGEKVDGDKIIVGDISGNGIAIGREAKVSISRDRRGDQHVQLFESVYRQIEIRPDNPDVDRAELIETVKKIQQEVTRGKQANPNKIKRWLNSLTEIAPDISRAVVADLLQPAIDVTPAIRQIAARTGPDIE